MARGVYQYELVDPDFSWLLSKFQENHPEYYLLDGSGTLPLLLIKSDAPQDFSLEDLKRDDKTSDTADSTQKRS